ncbi:hypothetical protein CGRA01v4_14401 [Colletotrichum graminicola]|nr:hypothetical protein CGRA01v4_14401 [Colletotrichum graminicola]
MLLPRMHIKSVPKAKTLTHATAARS